MYPFAVAQLNQPLSRARFRRMIRPVLGLWVSRPWLGYGHVLFLELGRLHLETVEWSGAKPPRVKRGQATLLFHCDWKAESGSSPSFGIKSPVSVLRRGVAGLRDRRVSGLDVENRGCGLVLELSPHVRVRTEGAPDWDLFLLDERLFPRESRWNGVDHTLGVGTSEEGELQQFVCYAPRPQASAPGP